MEPRGKIWNTRKNVGVLLEGDSDPDVPKTTLPNGNSGTVVFLSGGGAGTWFPYSVQLPSSPSLSFQLPPAASSFGKNCTPYRATFVLRGRYDHLAYDRIHEFR